MTYSIYIIEKSGERIHWSIEQSYADAIKEVAFLRKYDNQQAVIIENL